MDTAARPRVTPWHLGSLTLALALGCGDSGGGTSDAESTTGSSDMSTSASASSSTAASSSGQATAGTSDGSTGVGESETGDPPGPESAAWCFEQMYENGADAVGPDYDQFELKLGSHCKGTNHQEIEGVERVVFLGDSVTVGSPPTEYTDFYRTRLANSLAARFGLQPPSIQWQYLDLGDGMSAQQESGAFASCAKWGARTDDVVPASEQVANCFPEDKRALKTLVVMTIGGNDLSAIIQDGIEGVPLDMLWEDVELFIDYMRETIEWLSDPQQFPNGVYVVFANVYEFTDGTGELTACPAAASAGFDMPWEDPDAMNEIAVHANEQFVSIAGETGTDVIFMFEHFCGHGYKADDPAAPCYRGPGSENWFDLTCIHPNPTGHAAIEDLFLAVIDE
ncbi:MAG: SGNH/GDSL hydrolase family protein [Myxococcales bacterium]|nr:SGNH/GDSL hydrolase family protein [Myxococcales bacterium]MCB9756378.1 SGNH/GDSL hydrolase family protein [Myxococcales bacterium]